MAVLPPVSTVPVDVQTPYSPNWGTAAVREARCSYSDSDQEPQKH
jgi:hypothetical protein